MGFGDFLSNVGGGLSDAWTWLGKNQGTDEANKDRDLINPYLQQGNPYINSVGPQQDNYGALVSMLQKRANGQGPSIAQDAYKQASGDAMNRLQTMSNGSSPGAMRAAIQQMGNMNQGMASGLAQARNQEIVGATGQLGGAIGAADNSQLMRDKANQDAWMQMMAQRFGLTKQQLGGKTNGEQLGGAVKSVGGVLGLF